MHALNLDNIIDNGLSFDKQFYHKHGFVKIQHLLTADMVSYLKNLIDCTPSKSTFDTIKKNTYNVGIDDQNIKHSHNLPAIIITSTQWLNMTNPPANNKTLTQHSTSV